MKKVYIYIYMYMHYLQVCRQIERMIDRQSDRQIDWQKERQAFLFQHRISSIAVNWFPRKPCLKITTVHAPLSDQV